MMEKESLAALRAVWLTRISSLWLPAHTYSISRLKQALKCENLLIDLFKGKGMKVCVGRYRTAQDGTR